MVLAEIALAKSGSYKAPALITSATDGRLLVRFQTVSARPDLRKAWASAAPMFPRPTRVIPDVSDAIFGSCEIDRWVVNVSAIMVRVIFILTLRPRVPSYRFHCLRCGTRGARFASRTATASSIPSKHSAKWLLWSSSLPSHVERIA